MQTPPLTKRDPQPQSQDDTVCNSSRLNHLLSQETPLFSHGSRIPNLPQRVEARRSRPPCSNRRDDNRKMC
jgi:hypothetical protein